MVLLNSTMGVPLHCWGSMIVSAIEHPKMGYCNTLFLTVYLLRKLVHGGIGKAGLRAVNYCMFCMAP